MAEASDLRTLRGCQELVARFQEKVLPPGITPKDQFMKLVEEIGELAVGLHKNSRVLTADALADCLYVLCGIANMGGYDLADLFDTVHASNMTKTRDGGLSPKGAGFVAPKLSRCAACCEPFGGLIGDFCPGCKTEIDTEERS